MLCTQRLKLFISKTHVHTVEKSCQSVLTRQNCTVCREACVERKELEKARNKILECED